MTNMNLFEKEMDYFILSKLKNEQQSGVVLEGAVGIHSPFHLKS